jgi:glucose/arabinose dehydrogenase
MRIWIYRLRRQIAGGLVFLLAGSTTVYSAAMPLPPLSLQQSQSTPTTSDQSQPATAQTESTQSGNSQASPDQLPDGLKKPVGTAAAPIEPVTGVTASRPVGAAIAPAKQRRARAILIRVSIVVGTAVAVGTVVALSHASPSRPN